MAPEKVILFARAPVLGTVKSRLAAAVGPEAALAVYRNLLSIVLRSLREFHGLTLCITPDDSEEKFGRRRKIQRQFWPQGGGDLGARLARAFARAFDEGSSRVVIIGADCPDLRAEHIREAWQKLGEADLVVGPARDGGYWLIGLSKMVPELFRDLPWGGATLFERTLTVARDRRLSVATLETLDDIDTVDDWAAYKRRNPET